MNAFAFAAAALGRAIHVAETGIEPLQLNGQHRHTDIPTWLATFALTESRGEMNYDVDLFVIGGGSGGIGTVGMTERQARGAFDSVAIYHTSFRALKEMATGKQQHTLMKVIVDRNSDRILGVHLFAEQASELIQLIAVAVRAGATMKQFLTTMAVHPTLGEELVTLRNPVEIHNRHCE